MTVKSGNLAGTVGTPPQVPPNSVAVGSEAESGRRPGAAKWPTDVDVVVGGDIGGSLKVTCHGHPH